eukprot:3031200-Pyramimonas_sp.AAC.1
MAGLSAYCLMRAGQPSLSKNKKRVPRWRAQWRTSHALRAPGTWRTWRGWSTWRTWRSRS